MVLFIFKKAATWAIILKQYSCTSGMVQYIRGPQTNPQINLHLLHCTTATYNVAVDDLVTPGLCRLLHMCL